MKILVCAHRGASAYAPENTMAAFRLACDLGADAIETDVQACATGELVLLHDETVDRTSDGKGDVGELSFDELRALDFGKRFHSRFENERIPTLDELLVFAKGKGTLVNIELKTDPKRYNMALALGVSDAVIKHGLERRVIVSSFHFQALRDLRMINPRIDTAILFGERLENPGAKANEYGARYAHPYFGLVDRELTESCASYGVSVNPWTVDNPADMERMKMLGVHMIITNYPDRGTANLG